MTIDAGAVLALTGTGSYYGKTMSRGLDLAAKHIEAAGGPKINLIYLDHKSGDAGGRQGRHHRAGRQERAGQVRVVRRRPHRDARRHGPVQDLHLRRRRRHRHRRPGQAVLLGHPRHHAQRPAAGPLPVHEAGAAERQDRRRDLLGHWCGEQRHHTGRRAEEDRRRGLHPQRALRVRARRRPGLLPGAPQDQGQRARHPAARPVRPGHRLVHQPGRHRGSEGHPVRASSSRPTA